MIATNWAMRQLAGPDPLAIADPEAVTPADREILASGWITEPSGANVLADLRTGYHGPYSRPGDLTGYEAAVNGRGFEDQDITAQGQARERELLVRALSFAAEAMGAAHDLHGRDRLTAMVSLSMSSDDVPVPTAKVTFYLRRDEEQSYLRDVEDYAFESLLVFDYAATIA
ncbi:hypothetical protein KGQ20_04375 [Catenulispora sp. NF23]|uniref:hypothetical protein n=1 Tax=Catenulispora pinistramenti TaxID=2705254 RepID=UPI001BA787AA|nr:hypothetical protein [Catenulispora pinistramenti]MBS2531998.1 hypothetical protein [Catenulispora pinistramenti]